MHRSSEEARIPTPQTTQENNLLAALGTDATNRLLPHLKRIPMPLGRVLYESGIALEYVYFPIDCIVSQLYVMEDGHSAEISVVGNEGMLGIAVFMGGNSMPSRALIQSAGDTYRMSAEAFKKEFSHPDGALRVLLLRYTQALITQMAQTAVCNRHHSINLQLIAEGVETSVQLAALKKLGCEVVQGFLFSRPLLSEALWAFVMDSSKERRLRDAYASISKPATVKFKGGGRAKSPPGQTYNL